MMIIVTRKGRERGEKSLVQSMAFFKKNYQEITCAISCWPPTPFCCGGSLFSAEFPNKGLAEPPTDENCCCLLFRAFNDSVLVVKTSLKSFVVLRSLPAKQQASKYRGGGRTRVSDRNTLSSWIPSRLLLYERVANTRIHIYHRITFQRSYNCRSVLRRLRVLPLL